MNTDRPLPGIDNQLRPHSCPAPLPGKCYLDPAPLADVMFDQLDYLLAHNGRDCSPDCGDCSRLQQVKNWLLLPFRSQPHAC